MKYLVIALILLALHSCGPNDKTDSILKADKVHSSEEQTGLSQKIAEKLIGDWEIYVFDDYITCNVCPRIEFKKEKIAVVTLPSNTIENYHWNVVNGKLEMKSIDKEDFDNTFNDDLYAMYFDETKEYTELTLDSENFGKFTLRK